MTLEDIWQACRTIRIVEERTLSEEYAELVFFYQNMQGCLDVLESFLGPPVKLPGTQPAPEHLVLTKEFGGIYKEQTLFEKEINGNKAIAMLWPWADGIHITLKLALVEARTP